MTFDESLQDTVTTLQALAGLRTEIDAACDLVLQTLRGGGKLLICGNGGSAGEAQHFSTELVGRYLGNRRSLPAVALTSDGTLLSCIANDFGWDEVFVRQIEGLAKPGDLVVGMTTSGRSPNVIAALKAARRLGLSSLSLLGKGGGACLGLATVEIVVPGSRTAAIQEAHLFLIHHICERIEAEYPPAPEA
jgi:D-sedoheptulose 7-phosphate isomerase